MTLALPIAIAVLAVAVAVAHSWLSERIVIPHIPARSTRIVRAVFHLPSFAWAIAGIGVLAAGIRGDGPVMAIAAAALFFVSAVGNIVGAGRFHFGAVLLGVLAAGSAWAAVLAAH